MCGGNPKGDAYGFRNWQHNAFKEYRSTGTLGQFEGFCAALWSASFCVTGPEYLSMVAGEAKRPRIYIKAAFKTVYWRFAIFFMGGALVLPSGKVEPSDGDEAWRDRAAEPHPRGELFSSPRPAPGRSRWPLAARRSRRGASFRSTARSPTPRSRRSASSSPRRPLPTGAPPPRPRLARRRATL